MARCLLVALSLLSALPALAHACWSEVAQRRGIPADLLYAIASVESGLNPKAVNRSHLARTGSYDIGLMQVNSRHLPRLARYGITEASLYDPCTNLDVGAWLLADLFSREGLSWDSVGAYNAACTQLKGSSCTEARARYAWRVYRQLPGHQLPAPPTGDKRRSVATPSRPGVALVAIRVSP